MSDRFKRTASWLVALAMCIPAGASTIVASGAGGLTGSAQDLTGVLPTEILGSIPVTTDPIAGVNVFKFKILNYLQFSAIARPTASGIPDTELFLFDSSGNGVLFNDDASGANTLSCLPSADAGVNPCPTTLPGGVGPTSNGVYYLAITRSANSPLDGTSASIFTNLLSTDVVGPNSGAGPLAGWDGGYFTQADSSLVNYDILLTGTTPVVATPEPATWAMIALAGVGFALARVVRYSFPDRAFCILRKKAACPRPRCDMASADHR